MAPTIHLVRHAQGVHNLCQANESAHDPDLTPLGLTQCAELKASFPHHSQISRLVASPLRRTLNTCIESFGTSALYPITTLETLQEISDAPCDTGSTREVLKKEFGEKIDVENLHVGWTDKGKGSKFEPEIKKLFIRAREARCKLRELAGDGDGHIVVVSHGGFLHFLTDDWHGIPSTSRKLPLYQSLNIPFPLDNPSLYHHNYFVPRITLTRGVSNWVEEL